MCAENKMDIKCILIKVQKTSLNSNFGFLKHTRHVLVSSLKGRKLHFIKKLVLFPKTGFVQLIIITVIVIYVIEFIAPDN